MSRPRTEDEIRQMEEVEAAVRGRGEPEREAEAAGIVAADVHRDRQPWSDRVREPVAGVELDRQTAQDLRRLAAELRIEGWERMSRAELLEVLSQQE